MLSAVDELQLVEIYDQVFKINQQQLAEDKSVPPTFMVWANVADVPKDYQAYMFDVEEGRHVTDKDMAEKRQEATILIIQNLFFNDRQMMGLLPVILTPDNLAAGRAAMEKGLELAIGDTYDERIGFVISKIGELLFGSKDPETARKNLGAQFIANICKATKAIAYAHSFEAWGLRVKGRTKSEMEANEKYLASRGDMRWPAKHPDKESTLVNYLETRSGIRCMGTSYFNIENDKVIFEEEGGQVRKQNVHALDFSKNEDIASLMTGRFCNLLQRIKGPNSAAISEAIKSVQLEKEKRESVV